MALSDTVKESLRDAQEDLRNALAAAEDDHSWITDSKKWIDYTELPDSGKIQTGNVEINTENTGMFTEDELVAKGYQLTDTGWVKA